MLTHRIYRQLRIEELEPRVAPATCTFRAGAPVVFQDDDGSLVRVSLTGPGTGGLTLANGRPTWAQIDTISLAGTTERSRLYITSTGGSVPGTSFKTMTITEAPGAALSPTAFPNRSRIGLPFGKASGNSA